MHIVNIGHVVIDQNTSENATYTAAGGVVMFMQKIFGKLPDVTYTIVSSYGKDFEVYKSNITIYPTSPTFENTPRYVNVSKQGARTQRATRRQGAGPVLIDDSLKHIVRSADVIIVSPLFPTFSKDYLSELFVHANPLALKVLLPQGYYRDFDDNDNVIKRSFAEASDILPFFDLMIVSEQDGDDMDLEIQQWIDNMQCTFVVTRGERGCQIISNQLSELIPTVPLPENEIVDSVGSGDIFSAAFVYKYKLSRDLVASGTFANGVARECLSYTPIQLDGVDLKSLQ